MSKKDFKFFEGDHNGRIKENIKKVEERLRQEYFDKNGRWPEEDGINIVVDSKIKRAWALFIFALGMIPLYLLVLL